MLSTLKNILLVLLTTLIGSNTPSGEATPAGEARKPTGRFSLGNELADTQPLPDTLADFLSPDDVSVALARSVCHKGNTARLIRVMEKAMAGKPITIGAIGGYKQGHLKKVVFLEMSV